MPITADYTTLMDQASMTADSYMNTAKHKIDRTFGEGYAAKHPDLIAAFMNAACKDFNTAVYTIAIQEASHKIESALHAIADSNN
ncbi:hypothetical protein V2J93_16980 [Pseudomonas alliivorans]|nr:hypothetical protein [Pseudomonas alliivorans]